MRYRTKLYLFLMGMAVFSTILALGIVYFETKHFFFRELQSKVTSIAATAAASLNPETLKLVKSNKDVGSPAYLQIQAELRKLRDANRRKKTYIKYLYTIMPDPNDPNRMVFGIDPEENPKDFSNVGDADPHTEIAKHLDKPYVGKTYEKDQWGVWLTGYAPVFDSNGQYVATVGADLEGIAVHRELNRLIFFGFSALGGSLILAAICARVLARSASTSLETLCRSVKEIGHGNLNVLTRLKTHDEFGEVATAMNQMVQGLKERERLKSSFARYVSSYMLEKILQSESGLRLEGERRKVTILFSDIRHFTAISEKLPPEKVVSILNEYFDQMLEAIFSHQGTLDKFMGDGLMVEFGAPLDDPEQEKNAILCALDMQKKLQKLCEKWERQGKIALEMGIGIHTGMAIVGNIGSEERMQYTAVGDTVNVAARLEQVTKALNQQIIISEETYKGLGGAFSTKSLGPLNLEGREGPINAYAIFPS